jgi:carbon-monoxide dehydrogenase medium subunit
MNDIEFVAPKTVADVIEVLNARGDGARILAGGTDLIVQLREYRRHADVVVDVKHVPEVNELRFEPAKGLTIGAAVPCYRICEDQRIAAAFPGLIDAVALIGGVQIQSRASVGGNLCNSSPAADTTPALIVHKAMCTLAGPKGTREVPVEKFCTAPGRNVLGRGEFLVKLFVPGPPKHFAGSYLRFIPRNEMDIAVVGVGAALTLTPDRKRCADARIALGAVAPTPLLVDEAGAALVDGELNDALIGKAAALAQAAARPITDMRGEAEYRKHLVGVLTRRAVRIAVERAGKG